LTVSRNASTTVVSLDAGDAEAAVIPAPVRRAAVPAVTSIAAANRLRLLRCFMMNLLCCQWIGHLLDVEERLL
jgi:hypothetical protein